jgi:glycosyltransferase involved in cell wall biosynthesis
VDLDPYSKPVDALIDLDDRLLAERKYMLFLGRLSHRKGLDILLNAIASLPITGDVELVIAGSGDERSVIQQLIVQLDLQSRVRLVGRVDGSLKAYLLQNAMCVVVPSRGWEAFPLVVLEAYAAGRPVVGSRIAGLEDVIVEGETGLLATAESVPDWAAVLQKVRDDPKWVEQAGGNARKRAADYGWDEIARRHIRLYQSLK